MSEIKNKEISVRVKELIIARIDSQIPSKLKLFMGSSKGLDKNEIIEHIRGGDKIGVQIVESQMNFLKALTSGEFVQAINSV